MRDFSYIAANTVPEAVALLDEKGESARILAGGTDLIVQFEKPAEMSIGLLMLNPSQRSTP